VGENTELARRPRTNSLTIVGQTAGVGFVSFIFILIALVKNGAMPNVVILISLFYFAAVFGICFMILRHGSVTEKNEAPKSATEDLPAHAYLRPITTAQLEDARDPGIDSVTDATTRTLDEMKIERR